MILAFLRTIQIEAINKSKLKLYLISISLNLAPEVTVIQSNSNIIVRNSWCMKHYFHSPISLKNVNR